ncbi:MAG TPA: RNA polymerase subunit sigma-24 [Marinilabiliales bacterium]|jgi:RNA polymerase sigma-70 factor (ECF subfamily)|nr:MAG: hypothetical protein A2W95_17450 [Bacteroidetes bacterium GWA2_40_14]OFX57000.1 MAG: hypothetical protein A2W84_11830 [Bacteroidetes bacterium GWC2_40_13]OFX74873.1 MAG: hypothetical protein A2W96_01975 [Bacteroidetes bacterium GWD2_40_43]OFX93416.1 MAG: hypothetical protein A2W97_15305 [Bacteroidetes bacterium GWE2_40_63]OFY18429.1 MAG: hypothetical protein A2W88_19225 [Bacteroidetes bacterium GWF2_40_13]OFZ26444.1 MAG: hypothetical protein A2437_08085 [Bacteroidetes bacterium RIFOXYC
MKLIPFTNPIKTETKTDSELIALYKETHQTEYVGELFDRYHHKVFGVALKYLRDAEPAKDALLEIFSHLFEQLLKYKIDDFNHWLLAVTRNHCLRQIKTDQHSVPFDKVHENYFSPSFMELEHELDLLNEKEKKLAELESALKLLKPEQRTCVQLFYLEDRSYQDISEATGFELNKVKSYIQNGKRNLQIILEQREKKQ